MSPERLDIQRLARTRDLSVPDWGPYGKLYAGASHLLRDRRASVDFMFAFQADGGGAVLPGFAGNDRRNFHAFGAAPDLGRFAYKFDLEGLTDLTALVEFAPAGPGCAARVRITNRTARRRSVAMEILAAVPPELKRPPELRLAPGELWVGAEDYSALECWSQRLDDGFRNQVKFDPDAVGGLAVSGRWAMFPGTRLTWRLKAGPAIGSARLGIRYLKEEALSLRYLLAWDGRARPAEFPAGPGYRWLWLDLGAVPAGDHELTLLADPESRSDAPRDLYGIIPAFIQLDGFALTARPRESLVVEPEAAGPAQVSRRSAGGGRFVFSAGALSRSYAVELGAQAGAELRAEPVLYAAEECAKALRGAARLGCLGVPAISVPAGGEAELELAFAVGADEAAALAALSPARQAPAGSPAADGVPARFELGYRVLAANCLMSIAYPTFLPGEVIAAYSPGKQWGGLYSWDSGLGGIGLLEASARAAAELLNVYLCAPEEPAAFIWHGTPLPTQAHLLNELWGRTRDRELLGYFYPRIRKFYDFLLGHARGSPTDRFGNGLLNTYPLFYNTGGWDDLPPQRAVHARGLEDRVTAVCSTAHAVRFARLMRRFALALGREADAAVYDADIARGLAAVERTWDPAAGVYSYVWHQSFEPFRHESGANFNHTLDGLSPLVAGGSQPERAAGLLSRLAAPGRYWTAVGISTVDQAAPYYDPDGYWNGSVWIPHQWFLWRAALDWGDLRLARAIPRLVAEVWEREARRTHCSFELFKIGSGLGGGYPHFAGLSAPALAMIAAVSRPGRVTAGFDTEVRSARLDGGALAFEVRTDGPATAPAALAVMPGPGRYAVESAGAARQLVEADDLGCVAFRLPRSAEWLKVEIRPAS